MRTFDDVYSQAKRCIEIIAAALRDAGTDLTQVIRTRVMLTDISRWEEAARAHGEVFAEIRPATTFVEVGVFYSAGVAGGNRRRCSSCGVTASGV
jgi:enamine deaminase RidA (YjgF/YER057c/UK114 family)